MIRKFTVLTVMLLSLATAMAADMKVASFEPLPNDLTANTKGSIVLDLNGNKSALIKIETTQKGFSFDVGVLGVVKTEQQNETHPAEIWLYVPQGIKKLSIQHPVFGSINGYDLGQMTQRGKTYRLKLTTDQISTQIIDPTNIKNVRFVTVPDNAEIFFNGVALPQAVNGKRTTGLAVGRHQFMARAPLYHQQDGVVEVPNVVDPVISIRLKPAFGYLSIQAPAEFNGAQVYIDDQLAGTLPYSGRPLASGIHQLRVEKNLYAPYTQQVQMTDSATVNISPVFTAEFANVTIACGDRETAIYDGERLLGNGYWSGPMGQGTHFIHGRKDKHYDSQAQINVVANHPTSVTLPTPVPIVGAVDITSTPDGATVYLDGQKMGITPLSAANILIGPHSVKWVRKGYRDVEKNIEVTQGAVTRASTEMTNVCEAMVRSNIEADVYINNNYVGTTPYRLNVVGGTYNLAIKRDGYGTKRKHMTLNNNTSDINVNMRRILVYGKETYLQAGYSMGCADAVNLGLGMHYSGFNMEGNFLLGTGKQEAAPELYDDTKVSHLGFNVLVGWGFRIGSRVRITPQVGVQGLIFYVPSEKSSSSSSYTPSSPYDDVEDPSAWGALGGVRFMVALCEHLSVSVTPQYLYRFKTNDNFDLCSRYNDKFDRLTSGMGLNASLNIYF